MRTPNRERLNLLADALDSGKYKQGANLLRSVKDEFCCLGVACDISGEGTWRLPNGDESLGYYMFDSSKGNLPIQIPTDATTAVLNRHMSEWLGIHDMGAFTIPGGFRDDTMIETTLTELNDGGDFTFSMIADIVRSEAIEWV